MTDEVLKKKIVEVVLNSEITGIQIRAITGGYSMANNIADALISAGIGDVKETELRAEAAERAFSKLVHEMYEHGIRPMCDEKFFVESRLKDSEKELAEEKDE